MCTMPSFYKDNKSTVRVFICSNDCYPFVRRIAAKDDLVCPVITASLAQDMVKKLASNLKSMHQDGLELHSMFAISREEADYLRVDIPRKELKDALDIIHATFLEDMVGPVIMSRM